MVIAAEKHKETVERQCAGNAALAQDFDDQKGWLVKSPVVHCLRGGFSSVKHASLACATARGDEQGAGDFLIVAGQWEWFPET